MNKTPVFIYDPNKCNATDCECHEKVSIEETEDNVTMFTCVHKKVHHQYCIECDDDNAEYEDRRND
jgi:hypothetical protein